MFALDNAGNARLWIPAGYDLVRVAQRDVFLPIRPGNTYSEAFMDTTLSLEIPPDIGFARVLTTAAEALAVSRGMGKREAMRFQLAAEEFFTYLTQVAGAHGPVKATFTGKTYQACTSLRFQAERLSLGALNASFVAAIDDDVPHDLGLILAGRVADRFHLTRESDTCFVLHAEVDKIYPAVTAAPSAVSCRAPYKAGPESDPDALLQAAALAASRYQAWHCPASFHTPGKFADMALAGHFSCVTATDAASRPAGLLCWSRSGEKGLCFSGPFVFAPAGDAPQVAGLLMDAFLAAVARESAEIVFSERATPDAPAGYFETLGSLTVFGQDCSCEQEVLYRHLREDAGASVWAGPGMEGFLTDTYDRLVMCRDILVAAPPASHERKRSLFSAMMDKGKGLAVLRPLLDGEDAADILAAHVTALAGKGIGNILFYMDLSRSWEAALSAPLAHAGFKPRLILPNAGRSDIAVFQYAPAL